MNLIVCMTTLFVQSKMINLAWWLLFITSRFPHLSIWPMTEQKRKEYQGIRATEAFDYENTITVISIIVITEINEKLCQTIGMPKYPMGQHQIKLPLMLMV